MIEIGKVIEVSGKKVTIEIGQIRIQFEVDAEIKEGQSVTI